VNPSIIIGPGNWNSGSSQMIKLAGNGLKFYIGGETGYIGVTDVVNAMLTLMESANFEKAKNQRYLLSAENLSYRDFFGQAADAFGLPHPKIKATGTMLGIAWRGAKIWGFISGKKPMITREIVSISKSVKQFDGSKITRMFDFKYQPVSESIQKTAQIFRQEHHF
jgi:nucleoside-diphosphate-sugar epimerase